ncbi:MAG: hypothetical protein Kow0022_14320 [Phycisphaerales bacterium]
MADKNFRCRVVTPTQLLFDEPVRYATVPAWDGLFGVMHGTSPMVTRLGLGELRLKFEGVTQGGERSFFIDGGFAKMSSEGLTLLAESAIPVESLSESEAKAELAEAEARTVDLNSKDAAAQSAAIAHARNRARLKLSLAKKSRTHGI